MAKLELRIARQYIITAEFRLVEPLAIVGAGGLGSVDRIVARNGAGVPVIPGASLAGVIRSKLSRSLGEGSVSISYFGGTGDDEHASQVAVADSVLRDAVIEVRDGVGIDRNTGTAAAGIKYNGEVVAAGAVFAVEITVDVAPTDVPNSGDGGDTDQDHPDIVADLIALLDSGLSLGQSTSKGMGRAKLIAPPRVRMLDMCGFDATLDALLGGSEAEIVGSPTLNPAAINFEVAWEPVTSLQVLSGVDGNVVDMLPLVTSVGRSKVAFALPGSSIKGALRSHAERIVRTVLELEAPSTAGRGGDEFNSQLNVPLVSELFGRPAAAQKVDLRHVVEQQGRAALSVGSSHSVKTMSAEAWERISAMARPSERPTDVIASELDEVLSGEGFRPGEVELVDHVAIDRWTSAPSDGALFSNLDINLKDWSPIRLSLDTNTLLHRLVATGSNGPDRDVDAAVFLVLLLLRDFAEGWIPMGFGVNRGQGSVQMSQVGIKIETLDSHHELPDLVQDFSSPGVSDRYENAWREWVAVNRVDLTRAESPAPPVEGALS